MSDTACVRERVREGRVTGRERERNRGTEGRKGVQVESTQRGVYLYSESCGMARKWNNQ